MIGWTKVKAAYGVVIFRAVLNATTLLSKMTFSQYSSDCLPARECFLSDGQSETLKGTEAFCDPWGFLLHIRTPAAATMQM